MIIAILTACTMIACAEGDDDDETTTAAEFTPSIAYEKRDLVGIWFMLTSFDGLEIPGLLTFKEDGSVIVDDSLEEGGTQLFNGTPEEGATNSAVRGYWKQSENDDKTFEFRGIQFIFDPDGNPVHLTASFGSLVLDESNPKKAIGELNINRENKCTFFVCPTPNLEVESESKFTFTATRILEPAEDD